VVGDILQPTHLLLILVVALVVLGPKRLPEVGRSLGKGLRDFRSAISGMEEHTSGFMSESIDHAEPAPSEPAPMETAPSEPAPAPMETVSSEPAPMETVSSEPAPTSEMAPSEPAPTETPTPVEPSLAATATATSHAPTENPD
jgi:sec-independent protein translocase protein TatA